MISLNSKFEELAVEWEEFCKQPDIKYCSDIFTRTSAPAYNALVQMGEEILPLILERYGDGKRKRLHSEISYAWVPLVGEISRGALRIPSNIMGIPGFIPPRIEFMEQYMSDWIRETRCATA